METTQKKLLELASRRACAHGYALHPSEHASNWEVCMNGVCLQDRRVLGLELGRWACLVCSEAEGVASHGPHVTHALGEVCPRAPQNWGWRDPSAPFGLRMKPATMLKATIEERPVFLKENVAVADLHLHRIESSLTALETSLGLDARRDIEIVERMRALVVVAMRLAAERAYQGAWNQGTDGRPLEQNHFGRFINSILSGMVPAGWSS